MAIVAESRSLIVVAALMTLGLVTPASVLTREATGFQIDKPEILTSVESPVVLRTRPERFEFELTKDSSGGRNLLSILTASQNRHVHLVMRNFQVEVDPGVLYAVHLAHGPKKSKTTRKWLVGHINFYNAGQLTTRNDVFFSFDVTETLRKISEHHRSTDKLALFITPTGEAEPSSKVTIGLVQLVVQ